MFGLGENKTKTIKGQVYDHCGDTDNEEEIERFKLWCKDEGNFYYIEPHADHVTLWARPGKTPQQG